MAKPIGVDLGTYNSVAAFFDIGEPKIAQTPDGITNQGTTFPSFIKFDALGNPVKYGEEARLDIASPSQVVWGVKRLLGKGYEQVEPELIKFLYKILPDRQKGVIIPQGRQNYTPAEISSKVLKWIKDNIEDSGLNPLIGAPVNRIVISHPAYFDEVEKGQTLKAAELAGFSEVKLITEPEASALSYGLQLDPAKKPYVIVIDWGAGTLDIALHQLIYGKDNAPTMAKVKPPQGNLHLGGIDMDSAVIEWIISVGGLTDLAELRRQLRERQTVNLDDQNTIMLRRNLMKLNEMAQEAKIELSTAETATKSFPYHGAQHSFTITRKQYETAIEPQLKKFREHILWMIKDAGISPKDISCVLMVGGPMKMPCARRIVRDIFSSNKKVSDQLKDIEKHIEKHEGKFPPGLDPMECVAKGAAIYAQQLWGGGVGGRGGTVKTGTPSVRKGREMAGFDYGILLSYTVGMILIESETILPASGSSVLGGKGQIGGSEPVSLYKMELDSDTFQYHYIRRGNYKFSPSPDGQGNTSFSATLEIDENAGVTATFVDQHTGSEMELIEMDSITGTVIKKPFEPRREIVLPGGDVVEGDPPPQKPVRVESVPEAKAQEARLKSKGYLQYARLRVTPAGVNASARDAVEKACDKLENAVNKLPAKGPAPYKAWQDVEHAREELRNRLHAKGLLSEDEEQNLLR